MSTPIKHKFKDHKINLNTKILIIGTFNPDNKDFKPDFFYGRPHNFLWKILPKSFNQNSLKTSNKNEKLEFVEKHQVDFIDLISEVLVQDPANKNDIYLDNKVTKWNPIISEIIKLKNISCVCFTRKTFSNIPNIKAKIEEIRVFCLNNNIRFQYLISPARYSNEAKQNEWDNFFKICKKN